MSINTIQSSNIDLDEFEILKTGYGSFPALTVVSTAGSFNSGEAVTTIAHGLGFTPVLIVNIANAGSGTPLALPCPYENNNATASAAFWGILQAYADYRNVYLLSDLMVYGNTTANVVADFYVAQYYLVRERIKRSDT